MQEVYVEEEIERKGDLELREDDLEVEQSW